MRTICKAALYFVALAGWGGQLARAQDYFVPYAESCVNDWGTNWPCGYDAVSTWSGTYSLGVLGYCADDFEELYSEIGGTLQLSPYSCYSELIEATGFGDLYYYDDVDVWAGALYASMFFNPYTIAYGEIDCFGNIQEYYDPTAQFGCT